METWLLADDDDPSRRPLASLETFTVESRHGIRHGRSFAIASVLTEPSLRKRGHATRLLREVAAILGERRGAQALTLYSDVGAAMYEVVGYEALPAFDWVLPAARDPVTGVTRADDSAVAAVLAAHPPRGRFALLPDAAQVEWHRQRERIYARLFGAPIVRHPVLSCDGGEAIIAADHKLSRLVVLAMFVRDVDAALRLWCACADEAAIAGLTVVTSWASPVADMAVRAAIRQLGGTCIARDGAIPMIRGLRGAPAVRAASWTGVSRVLWV